MPLTARVSHSKAGKPVPIRLMVPQAMRKRKWPTPHVVKGRHRGLLLKYVDHRIYWTQKHNKTAEQYNSVVTILNKPCYRRYLEFRCQPVPRNLRYVTMFGPASINPRPLRIWILKRKHAPIACFTNVAEAFLVCISLHKYEEDYSYIVEYRDLTV